MLQKWLTKKNMVCPSRICASISCQKALFRLTAFLVNTPACWNPGNCDLEINDSQRFLFTKLPFHDDDGDDGDGNDDDEDFDDDDFDDEDGHGDESSQEQLLMMLTT